MNLKLFSKTSKLTALILLLTFTLYSCNLRANLGETGFGEYEITPAVYSDKVIETRSDSNGNFIVQSESLDTEFRLHVKDAAGNKISGFEIHYLELDGEPVIWGHDPLNRYEDFYVTGSIDQIVSSLDGGEKITATQEGSRLGLILGVIIIGGIWVAAISEVVDVAETAVEVRDGVMKYKIGTMEDGNLTVCRMSINEFAWEILAPRTEQWVSFDFLIIDMIKTVAGAAEVVEKTLLRTAVDAALDLGAQQASDFVQDKIVEWSVNEWVTDHTGGTITPDSEFYFIFDINMQADFKSWEKWIFSEYSMSRDDPRYFNPFDITPPAPISNLSTTVSDQSITFSWTDPSDADYSETVIWLDDGDIIQVYGGAIDSSGTMITGLINEQEYQLIIYTSDVNGNHSEAVLFSFIPSAGEFIIYDVDNTADVGWDVSLGFLTNGDAAISYWDHTNGQLRFARGLGSSWTTQVLDSSYDSGKESDLVVDSAGRIHISYTNWTTGTLDYALYNGSSWSFQQLRTGNNDFSTISVDSADNPHIAFMDMGSTDLMHIYFNGTSWIEETIDSAGTVGWEAEMSIDGNDDIHIAYYSYDSWLPEIKYAKKSTGAWNVQELNPGPGNWWDPFIAVDSNNNPHMVFANFDNHDLYYGYHDGTSWNFEAVGVDGFEYSLTIDENDYIHMALPVSGVLYHYKKSGAGWQSVMVDNNTSTGNYPSVVINSDGNPAIAYGGNSNDGIIFAQLEF